MRVGVFGGSFDPVHLGHLILAEQCREQARLDQVWFVPSARHPLKTTQTVSAFAQRVAMLELAVGHQSGYRVEVMENERPGPSYTADTLDELHRRHPDDELFLLLGADTVAELPQWHEPWRIIARSTLVVMQRPPWPHADAVAVRTALELPRNVELRMQMVNVPAIDIASRDIRQRVREGRTVRFMLPEAVEAYISKHALYQN